MLVHINTNILNQTQREYLLSFGFFVSFLIFIIILSIMSTNPSTLNAVLFPVLIITFVAVSSMAYTISTMGKTANRKENFNIIFYYGNS